MQTFLRIVFPLFTVGFLLIAGTLISVVADKSSVFIESEESKNKDMQSVFNEIRFIPGDKQDVWMMNQSHHGPHPAEKQWDRLAIVVDKTTTPKTARYFQLKPGPLAWEENLKTHREPYRVSCFLCHNNGPRALRPVADSTLASLGWKQKVQIAAWNFRMKIYGRIQVHPEHDSEDLTQKPPLRFRFPQAEAELQVKTCAICHRETGFLARGALQFQQEGTIKSLVARGEMPPPGFSLSAKEEKELEKFLMGL
ncbi:MAG TPA: hypothetical protein VGE46_02600 [Bdellovibrio sp.]